MIRHVPGAGAGGGVMHFSPLSYRQPENNKRAPELITDMRSFIPILSEVVCSNFSLLILFKNRSGFLLDVHFIYLLSLIRSFSVLCSGMCASSTGT